MGRQAFGACGRTEVAWMNVPGNSGTYPPGADQGHGPGSFTGKPHYPAQGPPVRPHLTAVLAHHRLVRPGPNTVHKVSYQ